ncbi:MAG: phosphate propanoyltransferase [Nanoarchaeota archaeon]
MKIPIEISARHVHLSKRHLEILFGKNYKLKPIKIISQPGQFAANEEVELINKNKKLKARVIGPVRNKTQIEISITDSYYLKLKKTPPINLSGGLKNSEGIIIKGSKEKIKTTGLIIAERHLHLSEQEAKKLNLKNNQKVKIRVKGKRGLIFENVIIRAGKRHKLAFQIDTDEANAAGINKKSYGELIIN